MKNIELKKAVKNYGTLLALLAIVLIFSILKPQAFFTLKNFIDRKSVV